MEPMKRRDFLLAGAAAGLGMASLSDLEAAVPAVPAQKGKNVTELRTPRLERVRVGFIGVGARGSGHVAQMLLLEGVDVIAICDNHVPTAQASANRVVKAGHPAPALYTEGEHAYEKMLARDDIDIVIIATPWEWHTPMAVAAMNAGKHAFVEVPAATTIEDCWKLVDTSERTQRHCMMMENVNYGREELMVLNMCRLGLFGELLHGEAAYIHDLRSQMNEVEHGTGSWRTYEYARHNGNLYPTHGLGPVAHYMNVNRGDRFDYLTSVSSPSRMRKLYAEEHFPAGHKWRELDFQAGDLSTTLIKTVLGRSIMVQWDEQLPRPYSRLNFVQGTKGAWGGFPNRLVLEGTTPSVESWVQGADLKPYYERYDHPLWTKVAGLPENNGGHGGMDFVMLWRIVYCLRNGLPLDQSVYDAAAWSSITPLSEASVAKRARSMDIPDFTRGAWRTLSPLMIEA